MDAEVELTGKCLQRVTNVFARRACRRQFKEMKVNAATSKYKAITLMATNKETS